MGEDSSTASHYCLQPLCFVRLYDARQVTPVLLPPWVKTWISWTSSLLPTMSPKKPVNISLRSTLPTSCWSQRVSLHSRTQCHLPCSCTDAKRRNRQMLAGRKRRSQVAVQRSNRESGRACHD